MNTPEIYEAWEFSPSTRVCIASDVQDVIKDLENHIDELKKELNQLKGIKQVPALLKENKK